jgi:hypothetical protein
MEVGLELVIIDGRVHAVKGDVDEIAGDDVHIGHRLGQQHLDAFEGSVDIGDVNHSHGCNLIEVEVFVRQLVIFVLFFKI